MTIYSNFVKSYMKDKDLNWSCSVCEIQTNNLYNQFKKAKREEAKKEKEEAKKEKEAKKEEAKKAKKAEPPKPKPEPKPEPKKPEPKPEAPKEEIPKKAPPPAVEQIEQLSNDEIFKRLSKAEVIDAINRFFAQQGKRMTNLGKSNLTRLKAIIDKFKIDLNSAFNLKKIEQERLSKNEPLYEKEKELSKKPPQQIGLELKTTKREDIGKEDIDELDEKTKKQLLEVASISRALEKEPTKEELLKRAKDQMNEHYAKKKASLPPIVSDRQEELEKMTLTKLKEIAKEHKIKTKSKMVKNDFIDEILKKEGIEKGFRTPRREYLYEALKEQHYCADKLSMGGLPQLLYRRKMLKERLEKAKSEKDQKKVFTLIDDLADVATKIEKCEKVLERDIKKEFEEQEDAEKRSKTPLSADELRLLKTYKKEIEKMDIMKKQGINMNEDMRPEVEKIIKDFERRLKFYGDYLNPKDPFKDED